MQLTTFLKILSSTFTVLVGVIPVFYSLFDNNKIGFFNRLNKYGCIVLLLLIAIALITLIVETRNQTDSDKSKRQFDLLVESNEKANKDLIEIKEALGKSGLKYDASNNSIINNGRISDVSSGNQMFHIGPNSQIGQMINEGNTMYTGSYFDPDYFEEGLREYARVTGIKNKEVYLQTFENTNGRVVLESIRRVLDKMGYKVIGGGVVKPIVNYNTKGVKFNASQGKIHIIAGNT